jgi:hypothetical protein
MTVGEGGEHDSRPEWDTDPRVILVAHEGLLKHLRAQHGCPYSDQEASYVNLVYVHKKNHEIGGTTAWHD